MVINRKTDHTTTSQKTMFPMIFKLSKPEARTTFLSAPLRHDTAMIIQVEKCVYEAS